MGFVNVWDELDFWLMTAVIVVPAVFALGLIFFPDRRTEPIRWWTLIGTLATFVLVCLVFVDFLRLTDEHLSNPDRNAQLLPARTNQLLSQWARHQPVSSRDLLGRKPWIGHFHIDYFIGVDGFSMALLLVASTIFVLAFIASWKLQQGVRGFCMLLLFLEACVMGLFLSLDFFLFFVFLEAMLVPLYLLIGQCGTGRRPHAAVKFFLFTVLGSVLILVAMLALYFVDLRPYYQELTATSRAGAPPEPGTAAAFRITGFQGLAGIRLDQEQFTGPVNTFDLIMLAQAAQASAAHESRIAQIELRLQDRSEDQTLLKQLETAERDKIHHQTMSPQFQLFCFLFLLLGFAVFIPIVPFHHWLTDAHEEASTPISMILAGVMTSVGGYGLFRIALPICPIAAEQLAWVVGLLGIIGIVYGALVALAQTDLKRLLAYASVSQMGFVLLGLSAWTSPDAAQYWSWGMKGAACQLITLGITSAGLFFLAGVLQERLGTLVLTRNGGVGGAMPVGSALGSVLFFALLGIPLTGGFIGQFCTLLGSWNFRPEAWPAAGQVFSMVAAGSLVVTAGYVLWTVQRLFLRSAVTPLDDLDGREGFVAGVCVVLTVALGIWPMLVFDWLEPTITGLVQALALVTAH